MNDTITPGQLAILVALRRQEGNATDVAQRLRDAGVGVPIFLRGALRDLEDSNQVEVHVVPGGPERGGYPKYLYRLTEKGQATLARVLA